MTIHIATAAVAGRAAVLCGVWRVCGDDAIETEQSQPKLLSQSGGNHFELICNEFMTTSKCNKNRRSKYVQSTLCHNMMCMCINKGCLLTRSADKRTTKHDE
jgi:hypothetical protein